MKTIYAVVLLGILSSCGMPSGKGEVTMTWDNRESFRDAAVLATAAVGAWASVASTEAAELTSRTVNTNASKVATEQIKSNTAIELGKQAAGVETTKILNPAP